jgi:hypothetical protein
MGPLQLFCVRPGTFRRLLDELVRQGAPRSQVKVPRVVIRPELERWLEGEVLF